MKTRKETFEDFEELQELLRTKYPNVLPQETVDSMFSNMEKMLTYADESDKWDEPCWGTDECVAYVTLHVLMDCVFVDKSFVEPIENAEYFYNFVKDWFKERVDHYRKRAEHNSLKEACMGKVMSRDCAKEVVEAIKNSKDE